MSFEIIYIYARYPLYLYVCTHMYAMNCNFYISIVGICNIYICIKYICIRYIYKTISIYAPQNPLIRWSEPGSPSTAPSWRSVSSKPPAPGAWGWCNGAPCRAAAGCWFHGEFNGDLMVIWWWFYVCDLMVVWWDLIGYNRDFVMTQWWFNGD